MKAHQKLAPWTLTLTTAVALSLSLSLTACENKNVSSKVAEDGNTTSGAGGTATSPGESGTTTPSGQASGDGEAVKPLPEVPLPGDMRSVNSKIVSKMPDTTIICQVNGAPVTVAQFKREYREAIVSLQTVLSMRPEQVQNFVKQAKALNIELSAKEKTQLLEAAKTPNALEGKPLEKFLQEKKMTREQFDKQVFELGLAFKVGAALIEQQLLTELVNREILMAEAKKLDFYRPAMSRYLKIKESPKYKKVIEMSDQTPEEVKEDLIQGEMMRMMLDKIATDNKVSDKKLYEFYNKNKARFKHGEKIHLAHIVIAAPALDAGPMVSIKNQLKAQNPKMTDAELNQEVVVVKQQKSRLAQEIADRAKKGEDFTSLANTYTEDLQAREAKNGGDLGYIDVDAGAALGKDQKTLLDAVKNLKDGQVAALPVETVFGYHVVKLIDRKPAGTFSFEDLKEPLQQQYLTENLETIKNNWLNKKRQEANIKLTEDFQKKMVKAASEAQPIVK